MPIIPAGRLPQEHDPNSHDHREDEPNTHRNTPGSRTQHALCAIIDATGEEDAKGDEELVGADKGAADLARGGLGLVHGGHDGEAADADAGDPAAEGDLVPGGCRGDLDDDADDEDDVEDDDGEASAERVC